MRILVCNDDGIGAPGLRLLEKAARLLSEDVWVVAPDGKRTAGSHALTIGAEIRLVRHGDCRYSCSGTPADCVVAALSHLMADGVPDLVLSGVNDGRNVGEDLIYSGTNAIAREATFWRIPAIAFSQAKGPEGERADARWIAGTIDGLWSNRAEWVAEGHWISINLPPARPRGIRAASIGRDKIAIACEVTERRDDLVRILVARSRQDKSDAGDENSVLKAAYATIIRPCWYGNSPLAPGFLEQLSGLAGQ
jgi:5'-nucleotidase